MARILGLDHPQNTSRWASLGLLGLRLVVGGQLLWLHGVRWARSFAQRSEDFADPLGWGTTISLCVAVAGAGLGGGLLSLGFLTRLVAVPLAVASMWLWWVRTGDFEGLGREPIALYAAAFWLLALSGAGRFSLDAVVFRRGSKK